MNNKIFSPLSVKRFEVVSRVRQNKDGGHLVGVATRNVFELVSAAAGTTLFI